MTDANRFLKLVLAIIVVAVLHPATSSAQVARVFLSGTGNDANVCTDASTPCRSLQGAINQCPVNGEIIVMTSGGFGTANITQSLTINAPTGVVAFNARTITVNIAASDKVVIRGLSLNGSVFGDPSGIAFTNGGTLIVENCLVSGFGDGIKQTAPGSKLVVNNSEFRGNTEGILSLPSSSPLTFLTIENCRFANNSYTGIDVYDWVQAIVRNTVATNNARGYQLVANVASGGYMMLDTCVASFNTAVGVYSAGYNQVAGVIRVTRSTVVGNATGISENQAGLVISYGTNHVWGNTTDGSFTSTVPTI